jgi:type I restriction enzyme S subunit
MGSEWTESTLEELSRSVSYGYTESASSDKVGPHFLRITDIQNGVVDWNSVPYCPISEKDHLKYKLNEGDIVVARTGNSTGENYIFEGDHDAVFASYLIKFGIDDSLAHPKFVWYSMRSQNWWAFVNGSKTGSAQAGANAKVLGRFPVDLPPLPEQKAIAHILGTLDDKIELNRQMNATLEAMAQALFKSWFVDFDPVIDNALAAGNPIPDELADRAEVRRQAIANGTANREAAKAFPDSFQETEEMGWIPEGWEERKIGDIFELRGGHSFKSNDYVEDGQHGVVTIKNVQDGSFVQNCTNSITLLPKKMKPHCILKAGEILLSLTGNVGRVCMVSDGTYVLNQRVSKIVGNDDIPEAFSYFFFRQQPLYERMLTIAKGTAQQNLSPIETAKLEQLMPGNELIKSLSTVLTPFLDKMSANTSESQSFTKLRDTLLPQLISGELRITKAEQLTEEALV